MPAYTRVNVGFAHELRVGTDLQLTIRLDIVNAFDTIYQPRDGSGVVAPTYGPRRGFFVELSKPIGGRAQQGASASAKGATGAV